MNTPLIGKNAAPDIIDSIRTVRNDLIKSLLVDDNLQQYLLEKYNLSSVSRVKQEFIMRSLNALLIAPVDLEQYGQLILEMRKNNEVLAEHHQALFDQDIDQAIKNFVY